MAVAYAPLAGGWPIHYLQVSAMPELLERLKEVTDYLRRLNLPAPNAGDLILMDAEELIARIEESK
jgi:hypothetical protein